MEPERAATLFDAATFGGAAESSAYSQIPRIASPATAAQKLSMKFALVAGLARATGRPRDCRGGWSWLGYVAFQRSGSDIEMECEHVNVKRSLRGAVSGLLVGAVALVGCGDDGDDEVEDPDPAETPVESDPPDDGGGALDGSEDGSEDDGGGALDGSDDDDG